MGDELFSAGAMLGFPLPLVAVPRADADARPTDAHVIGSTAESAPPGRRPPSLGKTMAWSVLAITLAATALAGYLVRRDAIEDGRLEFESRAHAAATAIAGRMHAYEEVLRGGRGLYTANGGVDRARWKAYVEQLDIAEQYPGVQGLGFAQYVRAKELQAFVDSVRHEGFPLYHVFPDGDREEYGTAVFFEPFASLNLRAFGYDMLSEPVRRAAMERARDTDAPALTGKLVLIQDDGLSNTPGFIMFLPVYARGAPTRGVSERREALVGWISAPFRVGDLMHNVVMRTLPRDALEVYDGDRVDPQALMFRSANSDDQRQAAFTHRESMVVDGRTWTLLFSSQAAAEAIDGDVLVVGTLGAGIAISMLLFGIVRTLATLRSRAMALAGRMTLALAASEQRLRTVTNNLPALIAYLDSEGRYRFVNQAHEDWFCMPAYTFAGRTPREIYGDALADELAPHIARCLLGQSVGFELRIGDPPRDAQWTLMPEVDALGRVVGVYVLASDVSERVQTHAELAEIRHRLQDIADKVPALIAYIGADYRYRFVNATYAEWFVRAPNIGEDMRDYLGARVYAGAAPFVEACLGGERVSYEYEIPVSPTRRVFSRVTYTPDIGEDGAVKGFYVLVTDLSERKAMEDALFEAKERAQVTLKSIGDAVVTMNTSGRITYLNPIAESMIGWANDEATGRAVEDIVKLIDADSREPLGTPLKRAMTEDRTIELAGNCMLIRRDGSEIAVEDSAAPIHDASGAVVGGVMVFHDVSDARAMALKMSHLAQHDALTALPNRALLNDRLSRAIALAERNGRCCALLFADLDNFKHVNDSLGHPVGDELLKVVAQRLTACVRRSDTVSRLGGDEFVLLLPEIDEAEDAARIALKVLAAGTQPFLIAGYELHLSFSVGVSVYPDDGLDAATLMMRADSAMYHAKKSGRNNFQFYTQDLADNANQRLETENALRQALRNQDFRVYYQPKVDQASGRVTGAEALVRWQRTPTELVGPAEFIRVAEDSRLILAIDQWMLRAACRQNKAWQDAGLPPIPIAVNVAVAHFDTSEFVNLVDDALRESGLDPTYLEIELTEGTVMKDVSRTHLMLQALKDMGVRIVIDDFGTGYSSLSYLCRFPFDTIKIDQSFVRGITRDPDRAAITAAIITMAKTLQHRTVAEGVETHEQAALLRAQGCDELQGYLFGRPMPADDFAALLVANYADATEHA